MKLPKLQNASSRKPVRTLAGLQRAADAAGFAFTGPAEPEDAPGRDWRQAAAYAPIAAVLTLPVVAILWWLA